MSAASPEPTADETTTPRKRGGRKKAAASESAATSGRGRRARGGTAYSDLIRNLFLTRSGDILTIAEVSDTIGQDRSAVGMGLSALARRGILDRVGTGQYRLAGSPGGPAPRAPKAAPTSRGRTGSASSRTTDAAKPAKATKATKATSPTKATKATKAAAPSRGRRASAPASTAATTSSSLQVVFTLPDGVVILSDGEGGLWQAHRVSLVAE